MLDGFFSCWKARRRAEARRRAGMFYTHTCMIPRLISVLCSFPHNTSRSGEHRLPVPRSTPHSNTAFSLNASKLTCRQASTIFLLPGNAALVRTIPQRVLSSLFTLSGIFNLYIDFPPPLTWRLRGIDPPARSGMSWHSPKNSDTIF